MSIAPQSCPSAEILEEIAVDREVSPVLLDHVEKCDVCGKALRRIREDNRFLSGFAIDGVLPAGPPAKLTGEIDIPGYDIGREIHRGGQGVVFQAVQLSTKRDVAIKVMKQGPFASLADRARFEREIETLAGLNHPNIVTVHDAGIVAGLSYLVMNYIDGDPLDVAILGRGPQVSNSAVGDEAATRSVAQVEPSIAESRTRIAAAIDLFAKVCEAVHAAHLRGVIHRDIKPSNIRVDRSGEPHVLDFGLAKSIDAKADSAMTRTGQFVGSLPWASPEQVEGESARIDLRTDVYSLGVVLFQMLTGALPFDVGSNLRKALDSILTRDPPRPSAVITSSAGPRIDDELDTIVLKCLSKDRERRYQSAGELARDLRRYLAGEPIEAKRDSALYVLRKTLGRYRLRVAAAGAFIFLLAAFGVIMSLLYRHSVRLEATAVHSAASLAELLSDSNIENGRMAGILGNLEQAEHLLWREMLTRREPGDSASIRLNDPPGPPQAYWALWELYRRRPCLQTLTPEPLALRTATMSLDGSTLWTADADGLVQRIARSGAVLDSYRISLPNNRGLPTVDASGNMAFHFDGRRFAVWWRDSGLLPIISLPPPGNLDYVVFSVSLAGGRFATPVESAAVVWNASPLAEVNRFPIRDASVSAIAISNDDRLLAARDRLGGLHIWEIDSKRLLTHAPGAGPPREHGHDLGDLLFSHDDRLLADAWGEIAGRIWNLTTEPPTAVELAESPGGWRVQGFSPDAAQLAVGDLGGFLRVFDTRSGQQLSAFVAHPGRIRGIFFTGDGRGIWTCGERELRLWEVAADAGVASLRIANELFHTVDISPDGKWYAAGGGAGNLHRVDRDTAVVSSRPLGIESTVSCVAISPDSSWIAAATYANTVFLCRADDFARPHVALPHPHLVSHVCFSPDGAALATACDDGVVRLWRVSDGSLERELHGGAVRMPQIAFDPSGRRLAAAVRDGALLVWSLDTNEHQAWSRATQSPLRAVRFSHDGRWLVAAGAARDVQLWDAPRREQVATLVGHNQEIYSLDISPDGELIASGDSGGAIRLWHLRLRQPLVTLDGHLGAVMAVRFAPDGRALLSASLDGTIREWDLRYYEQHIAGQVDAQLRGLAPNVGNTPAADAWREWAAKVTHGNSATRNASGGDLKPR